MMKEFQVGDRVRVCKPDGYEVGGYVEATDYHPLGDSFVKVDVTDTLHRYSEWVDARYVFPAK